MGEKIKILCYGDSNTWGYIPGTDHQRFPKDDRWPGALQRMLGEKFEIIEEGLNSRTLVSIDKRMDREGRSGAEYLLPCLDTHDPIDLVIIMLGTNELKTAFYRNPKEIGEIFEEQFVKKIISRKSVCRKTTPKLLIIAPPIITKENPKFIGGKAKSEKLNEIYEDIAIRNECEFLGNEELEVGEDGIHLSRDGHRILASKLAMRIKEIYK
ncbi:MAG: GDSL-type esterase/lipase family protein [Clostridia bacterium]|nr:hypothetical protein [Clostridia bacterium]MBP3503450.1 hypothetical protein [Clostridia bacterium]